MTALPQAAAQTSNRFNTLVTVGEWLFLSAAIVLWVAFKSYHPVMNAGIGLWCGAWVARWLRSGSVSRFTPIDVPLGGFVLSLFVAQWVAPQPLEAVVRLALLMGAIGLFYALVNSSPQTLTNFCVAFVGLAALVGLYFASQHPWAEQPAKIAALQTIGVWLQAHSPNIRFYDPHPNVVAGMLAVAVAVWLALFWNQFRSLPYPNSRGWFTLIGWGVLGLVLGFGFMLTQSRAGWLAVASALGLSGVWLFTGWLTRFIKLPQWAIFWMGIAFGLGILSGVIGSQPQLLTVVLGTLPGPNSTVNRVEIYSQVWRLAQDTMFTGAGLAAFPGLYSTFVLSVPSLYLTHAHNTYLQLFVEQGWLGAGAYGLALSLAAWFGVYRLNNLNKSDRPLVTAGLLGLGVVLVHGLADATLIASRIAPVVLIPAGLALSGQTTGLATVKPSRWLLIPVLALLALGLVFYKSLLAQWHANLGAIAQNQVVLQNWPTNEWDAGSQAGRLQPAEIEFQSALGFDPNNRIALYRLGLVSLAKRDFSKAARQLQQVYDLDATQRIVIKSLGYARLWEGNLDQALPLLAPLPETRTELENYVWWWTNNQGRPDLAQNALTLLGRMK